MRRISLHLNIHRTTVARKLKFLSTQARIEHPDSLRDFELKKSIHIQFDDLETSEHTKCKPLSVCLAVDQKSRKILAFEVSLMPAKGPLAEISRKKYGYRPDHRKIGLDGMFKKLKPFTNESTIFTSDEHTYYPKSLKKHFPNHTHIRVKSRRACIAGQGELKKLIYDPLFSLNHTCAMLRANMSRLIRRTWCTTKKRESLLDHLFIYAVFHNEVLT